MSAATRPIERDHTAEGERAFMKFIGLAAVIAATIIVGAPSFVSAQGVGATRRESPTMSSQEEPASSKPVKGAAPKIEKEQFTKGAKDGPAIIAAAGITCTPDQIYYVGEGKNPTTQKKVTAYEASCKEGLGYFLSSTEGDPKPIAIDCIQLSGQNRSCQLPGNAHPEQWLATRAQAAGRTCTATKASYAGGMSDGSNVYELACSGGAGFQVGVKGADTTIDECAMLAGTGRACKLTPADQVSASLAPAVQSSGRTCAIKDERYIGASSGGTGDQFYEVACQSGPGFVLVLDKSLAYRRALDCREAEGLGGGCKMTDAAVIQTQDNQTYSNLARKAGFDCQVAKYRFVGLDANKREGVELACANRPDGAFGFLSETGKSDIYDCARVGAVGQVCKLTTVEPLYAKYQRDLAAKGKTCAVTGVGFLAHTQQGDFVEVACGAPPGWAISYQEGSTSPSDVLSCPQIKSRGVRCQLPANAGQ